MRNTFLILLSFCICNSILGQSLVKEFDIHFSSGSSEISFKEMKVLKQNFDELTNLMKAYTVEISGYTDATGDVEINKKLSKQRALSVSEYMIKRGMPKSQITTQYFGASHPLASNKTEFGKYENRRTHIKIQTKNYTPTSIAGYELKPQEYNFSCEKGAEIKTESGSKFNIPEDAFVDENGNPVRGEVKVDIVEYRDPLDFVFANEPMNLEQDGKIAFFQSDGMFKIEAKQGDKKLQLAPGKAIESKIKLKRNQSESRFYAFNPDSGAWDNGQSINQNSLTLGHDGNFPNSKLCREGMTAFLLNSLYTNGDKLESDYNESLSKQKDSEGMGKVYKSAEVEEKRLSRKKDKVKSLEWKLKNKEHRYAFKKRQSKGLNSSFELQIHRKSNSKRQNETRQLNSLRLQVKRKDLKPRKRKMAFRSSTFVTNVRLKEADENYTLSYDVKIVKRKRGGNDVEQYQDSLTNVKLVTSGWLPVFNGNKTKTTAFKNYNKVLSKYDNVLEVGEAKLQAEKEKRDSIGKVVAKLNDTIASAEFVRKVERFTGFANHNALAFGGESKWVKDYDANNGVMNPNVDSVLMTNQYANCSFRNQAFMKEQVRQNKLKRALGAGLGVNLTSMGTYNADAIKQLKRPALIVADYKDEKGKKLDITVIYVFDKTLNGVMRFDGYMDRSPYKFEVSRENAKSLIAFDDEMNAYMIPNDVFKKKIQKSNVEFTLKPFKKAESKEDIKNQLATI